MYPIFDFLVARAEMCYYFIEYNLARSNLGIRSLVLQNNNHLEKSILANSKALH